MKLPFALLASMLIISCDGSGGNKTLPPPATPAVHPATPQATPIPTTPLTYEWLDEKKWSTTDDGRLVELTLETACLKWQDVEPYACLEKGTERMFHHWLYEDLSTNNAPLFFAVGQFELRDEPERVCFTSIHYWSNVPEDWFLIYNQDAVCYVAYKHEDTLVIDGHTFTSSSLHE